MVKWIVCLSALAYAPAVSAASPAIAILSGLAQYQQLQSGAGSENGDDQPETFPLIAFTQRNARSPYANFYASHCVGQSVTGPTKEQCEQARDDLLSYGR
jgi:hypothetical protein